MVMRFIELITNRYNDLPLFLVSILERSYIVRSFILSFTARHPLVYFLHQCVFVLSFAGLIPFLDTLRRYFVMPLMF